MSPFVKRPAFDSTLKWNVTPLLGHFGGRAAFCCRELLSLFCLYEDECMLAGPRDCNKGIHPIKLCELSLLFNKKEGVEEQFPEVVGISNYEKSWNHLDKRELRDFRSTKLFT